MVFGYTEFIPIFQRPNVMSLPYVERRKLFEGKLKDDEEILWIGESQHGQWRLLFLGSFIVAIVISSIGLCSLSLIFSYTDIQEAISCLYAIFWVSLALLFRVDELIRFLKIEHLKGHYAITNQCVLIYRFGNVTNYSLLLLADAIKHKPKRGRTTISLYDKTSYTGRMPKPIAKLNNLSNSEAEKAYELLKDTREDSFLDRIAELEQEQTANKTV